MKPATRNAGQGAAAFAPFLGLLFALGAAYATATRAETHFLEAESFEVAGDGWRPFAGTEARSASDLKTLCGAAGAVDSVASARIEVVNPGTYRTWARYLESRNRGPFTVRIRQEGRDVAVKTLDLEARPNVKPGVCDWVMMGDAPLAAGFAEITLEKHEKKNCSGYTRHVDCLMLTDDLQFRPSHYDYGPQTWLRVTLADLYDRPVYVHVWADHYRAPWSSHYAISRDGMEDGLRPSRAESLLKGGESTGWINISRAVYQDSGVCLHISIREKYSVVAPRLKARFEFATAPEEKAVVRDIERDAEPGGISIVVPPDLGKPENRDRLVTDLELAETTGRLADAARWPALGRSPARFPFRVSHSIDRIPPRDQRVVEREWKTLDYFGFNNASHRRIPGIWFSEGPCYSRPDLPKMQARAREAAEEFRAGGGKTGEIAWAKLTDEACGQPLEHLAGCAACGAAFRDWLRGMKLVPSDLGVSNWEVVKPVSATNSPALYYYSQRFRTRALGEFQRVQRSILREAYGADFPAVANNSDGATYHANFSSQGVDYFEMLDSTGAGALWGEDWGNHGASRQCTTYNVELMRSAAMKRGEPLGTLLISHAGRLPWDIKLNAVSQVARDIKYLESYGYGPPWGTHEGGPPWACSAWQSKPDRWFSMAELVREVGAAEDFLLRAKKARSPVAILYSSSSDIWTVGRNHAYGFDRMFTWLALAHRQVPVDFLSEKGVAEDELASYRVCYLSGPNLTRAAATKLVAWVKQGGVLVTSAGAASRDEFDRRMAVLDEILPAKRGELEEIQPHLGSGGSLHILRPLDSVALGKGGTVLDVFSLKQALVPKPGAEILGSYAGRGAAYVSSEAGGGRVYQSGFLPGLSYMHPALLARRAAGEAAARERGRAIPSPSEVLPESALPLRSASPWQYPSAVREMLVKPVAAAAVSLPIHCDVPLVDAILMEGEQGAVVPLANYTLQPLKKVTLSVRTKRRIERVESVHHGTIAFVRKAPDQVEFSLSLRETDFVLLRGEP